MSKDERATKRAEGKPMYDMPLESVCGLCGKVIAKYHLMCSDAERDTVRALGVQHRKTDCPLSRN